MSTSVAIWTPKHGVLSVREGDPTRCASVLKPVYTWVQDHPRWDDLAPRMITVSDNSATDEFVGDDLNSLSNSISARTDVRLEPFDTWGAFQVTALDLVTIYATLLDSDDDKGRQVRSLMESVCPEQRFGFLGPLKAGWDMYTTVHGKSHLVTNIVVGTYRGIVAATSDEVVSDEVAAQWRESLENGGPNAVIDIHRRSIRPNVNEMVGAGISKMVALP